VRRITIVEADVQPGWLEALWASTRRKLNRVQSTFGW
jgi:hypothetical protein